MYCASCGVKLSDTEKRCPLCGTAAYHPDIERASAEPLYPEGEPQRSGRGRAVLCGAVLILFLVPLVLSLFSDLQKNGRLDWFGYVAGGLLLTYITFALPFWFKRAHPIVFVPCSFAAAILYLGYVNFTAEGNWFLTFAFPLTFFAGLIASFLVGIIVIKFLLDYLKKGSFKIFAIYRVIFAIIILIKYFCF